MTTNLATDNLSQENVKLIGNRYIIKKTLGSGNCGTAFLTLDGKTKNFEKYDFFLTIRSSLINVPNCVQFN